MVRKQGRRERKVPAGVALPPSLWERIDQVADAQQKTRSEVVCEVLSLHVPVLRESHESYAHSQTTESTVEVA